MKWLLGIDIGGTTVKMAILDLQGIIVEKWEIETVILNDGEQIPGDIATSFFEKCKESNKRPEDFVGAGIGAPGFIDFNTGVVERAVNIGWNNFELIGEFERLTGLPAVIENDANAAAIGEMWKGAGSGATELLAVTLGTGVGGGLITNGQIVHGTVGMAGEIGHITMLAEGGVLCGCGRKGCLETIASATGVARLGLEKRKGQQTVLNDIQAVTAKDVFDAYTKGDRVATEVIEEVTFHLGLAISNLANSINPEMIVIGGGVSKAGDALMVPLKKQFERFALPRVFESTTFKIAELENDAGVIGCAWLAKQMFLKK